jgi:hypothetical protein
MECITLKNSVILAYFKKHPEMNPEVVFMFFVEFLDKMHQNGAEYVNTVINQQLIDNLYENNRMLSVINENVCKTNQDITNVIYLKMLEVKKEYMEEMKNTIGFNMGNITMTLERNYLQIVEKTSNTLHEIAPKANQHFQDFLNDKISMFQHSLRDELKHISNLIETDDAKMNRYLGAFEKQFTNLLQTIHQPLHVNMSQLQAVTNNNIQEQSKLFNEMSDFMKKYKISAYKGSHGETRLSVILNTLYPSGELIQTTSVKASGDFLLKRIDKPDIMFENKDYADNVGTDEIRKFIRDAEHIRSHAIFLSQHSGVSCKNNYQIDNNNGIILVYVHHANYTPEKIQIAVDIIDSIHKFNKHLDSDNSYTVQKDLLDSLNREYQQYAMTKDNLIGSIHDSYKRQLSLIDEFQLPSLEKYLSLYYASAKSGLKLAHQHKCEYCNSFIGQSKKSLSAHQRACKQEHLAKQQNTPPANIVVSIPAVEPVANAAKRT